MSFPTEPPIRARRRAWSFPDVERATLSTGLPVIALPRSEIPVVHIRLESRGGRAFQPGPGVAGMMAACARHGTAAYDSAALARRQDGLGARLGSVAGQDSLRVTAHGLSEHLPELLELVAEVGCRPTFPEAEVTRLGQQSAERRRHSMRQPGSMAGEWMAHALYGPHPYSGPLATPDELSAMTRGPLEGFHRAARGPSNSVLVAVGDVEMGALLEAAERQLSGWGQPTTLPAAPAAPAAPGPGRRVILVDRPGSEQATVSVGFQGLRRVDPGFAAARVMNQVLGGGASSRLFMDLRERRSLTYGCYTSLDAGALAGDLSASLSCSSDKLGEALDGLFEHFGRVRDEPVPDAELRDARDYLVGAFPNVGASLAGLCGMITGRWLHRMPADVWDTYTDRIEAIAAEAILSVARRLIDPERAVVVVVGEADALEGACARWGEVERRAAGEAPGR